MKRKLLITASLVCLSLLGSLAIIEHEKYIYASDHNSNSETNAHDSGKSSGHKSGDNHHHGVISIPEDKPVPSVDLIVHKDSNSGCNLEVKVDNFRLAPENVNQEDDYSEGHGHLYINGEKITRIYGNWYYIPKLESGRNEIKVSLNSNSHEALVYKEQMIEDTEIIEVP